MKKVADECPGCGEHSVAGRLDMGLSPIVSNYRFQSVEAAAGVARKKINLGECKSCGLVFNREFDAAATLYDDGYENSQCCSPTFREHLDSTIKQLINHYPLDGGLIIEVGCGKGAFLKDLCSAANATGIGFDTSCEESEGSDNDPVRFHRRYLKAGELSDKVSLIVCRHVVEHIDRIGEFFQELADISRDCGNAPIYIETPDWQWIVESRAHWDIFYEHCNYFTMDALFNIAAQAGFSCLRHSRVFGGQYQALEIIPRGTAEDRGSVSCVSEWKEVSHMLTSERSVVVERFQQKVDGKAWAIWGAGAKGVCIANLLDGCLPLFLIDSNPEKQGCFIPGVALEVVAPDDERLGCLDMILVVNPNYQSEISDSLSSQGIACELLAL